MLQVGGPSFAVARPTGICAATGRPLAPGERFVATLVERGTGVDAPGEGLERLDFALDAWSSGARPGPEFRVFGSWRSVVPESAARAPSVDEDALLDLFDQLGENAEPKAAALRYLLALLLIRRKSLVYEGATDGVLLVRHRTPPGTPKNAPRPPTLEVIDPGMDDRLIAEATEALGALVLGGSEATV